MGFNLGKSIKKIGKSVTNAAKSLTHGNLLKNIASIGAAYVTGGKSLEFDQNAQERLGSAITNLFGGDSSSADSFLNAFNAAYGTSSGTSSSPLSGINWGNSIFSAKQAKEMAKWNSELNYQYQTKLNEQGYQHDMEMLKKQQEYDTQMNNTAIQRQMTDLKAADLNPALAANYGGAGGGGLGGGSSIGGGTAQTSKADWLNLELQKMAGGRDAARVEIEKANSATAASAAKAQENKTNAEMLTILERLPGVKKEQEAYIGNLFAGALKSKAESAKSYADAEKTRIDAASNWIDYQNKKTDWEFEQENREQLDKLLKEKNIPDWLRRITVTAASKYN